MDNINKQLSLIASIEAILFYTAEPMSFKKLASLTKSSVDEVKAAAESLKKRLEDNEGGIRLLNQHDEVALGTSPLVGPLIEQIVREEISKELSKAALETLSIICYKGPLTRSEVDYIRGVNSTFIIRNLLIRGIVEKLDNPKDSRAMLYGPTFAALEYMGVTKIEDLPQYAEIQATLQSFSDERTVDEYAIKSIPVKNEEDDDGEEINSNVALSGDSDSRVILCDTNNDGLLTEEECIETSDNIIHATKEGHTPDNFDADISEENVMAPEFDDEEIALHSEEDEGKEVL